MQVTDPFGNVKSRYYIYDANGDLFGNPRGYALFCTARGICTRYQHKLDDIYDARPARIDNLIWTIKSENK